MNKEIQELLQSNNVEDVFLGIELLYRTEPNYFKRTERKGALYLNEYVPRPLSKVFHSSSLFPNSIYREVYEYCEQNNYWTYAAESE